MSRVICMWKNDCSAILGTNSADRRANWEERDKSRKATHLRVESAELVEIDGEVA